MYDLLYFHSQNPITTVGIAGRFNGNGDVENFWTFP